MIETIAKPVVKNKFWIVEHAGHKIATIQAVDENGGFVYVHNDRREHFPSIKLISKKYNIEFAKEEKTRRDPEHDMYGFPVLGTPSNQLLDVQRYLPIYTKGKKSKSCFCAGYYLVRFGTNWVQQFCPKLITLNRYEYQGPFKSEESAQQSLREINGR